MFRFPTKSQLRAAEDGNIVAQSKRLRFQKGTFEMLLPEDITKILKEMAEKIFEELNPKPRESKRYDFTATTKKNGCLFDGKKVRNYTLDGDRLYKKFYTWEKRQLFNFTARPGELTLTHEKKGDHIVLRDLNGKELHLYFGHNEESKKHDIFRTLHDSLSEESHKKWKYVFDELKGPEKITA